MKILKSMFSNVCKAMTRTNRNQAISEELLPTVGTFVENKRVQGVTSFTPYKHRTASQFDAIKYNKAKDVEEAKEFAQKVLGIKNYDIDDLELANQVNLSMTKAHNRTRGKLNLPENVYYRDIFYTGSSKVSNKDVPMLMSSYFPSNESKSLENTLEINKTFFENIDIKIKGYLENFAKNGQLSKNSKGLDSIELISKYKYEHTLNRYYRLYKQDKLTPKAKADFENLLQTAVEKESSLLLKKDTLTEYLQKKLDVNLKNLSQEEFTKEAINKLLDLRRRQKILLDSNLIQTKNAIGVDGQVLHELAHGWHAKNITGAEYNEFSQPFKDFSELKTAFQISPYAPTSKMESVGEIVKGLLSGDKYTDDIMQLGNECTGGQLNFLF